MLTIAALAGCGGGGGGGSTSSSGGSGGGTATSLASQYRLVAVPILSGGENTAARINNAGQVIGTSGPVGAERAYYWDATNGLVTLHSSGNPPDAVSQAFGLNSAGEAVGTLTYGGRTRGFYALQNAAGFIDPDAGGAVINRALGMNNARVIVGSSGDTPDSLRAVRFTQANGLSLLPDVANATMTEAYDINDRGDVCGWGFVDGKEAGIFWPVGGSAQRWVGNPVNGTKTRFYAVNSNGIAVGESDGNPVILVPGQNWENLQKFFSSGTTELDTVALDVSDGRLAAGYFVDGAVERAAAWNSDRSAVRLQDRLDSTGQGWVLNRATGVSNDGKICGYGTFNGARRAFVLIPR